MLKASAVTVTVPAMVIVHASFVPYCCGKFVDVTQLSSPVQSPSTTHVPGGAGVGAGVGGAGVGGGVGPAPGIGKAACEAIGLEGGSMMKNQGRLTPEGMLGHSALMLK